jgi:hypothetical protein
MGRDGFGQVAFAVSGTNVAFRQACIVFADGAAGWGPASAAL